MNGDISVKTKFVILFSIMFLISLISALAATEDFQYIAYSNVNVCACSNFAIEGSLTNLGDVTSYYTFSDFGTASSWSVIVPESVYLSAYDAEGNTYAKTTTMVNVPCNAKGDYTLYTSINTSFGLNKIHPVVISVNDCNTIEILPISAKNQVCNGDVAVYELKLKNTGQFDEILVPFVNKLQKVSQFNFPYYVLTPGKEETAYLYIASYKDIGSYNLNLTFNAQTSGKTYTIPLTYNAINCVSPVPQEPKTPQETVKQPAEKQQIKFTGLSVASMLTVFSVMLFALILLLFILFIILIAKAIKKKKQQQHKSLDEWIEIPLRKEKKQKVVYEEIKPEKKVNKRKLAKTFLWIFLILLIILLIAAIVYGVTYLWPYMKFPEKPLVNQTTSVTPANISLNATVTPTAKTSVNLSNPLISFFSSYGNVCSLFISVFFVLFILSLLLFGVKPKKNFSEQKQKVLSYIKYIIPSIFLILLVFSFIFCVVNSSCISFPLFNKAQENNMTEVKMNLTKNTLSLSINNTGVNYSANITNITSNANLTNQTAPSKQISVCSILGDVPTYFCIIVFVLVLILIVFIIWLAFLMPRLIAKIKEKMAKRKSIKKKEKVKFEKKVVAKVAEEKKESASSNIWKDILILLLLLLLLVGVITFFYYFNPIKGFSNESVSNITDNQTNATPSRPYISTIKPVSNATVNLSNTAANNYTNISNQTNVTAVDPRVQEVNAMLDYIKANNLTNDFRYNVMETGSVSEINLNENFVDPDNDTLFFSIENKSSENVSVEIWKGIAIISADEGYIGVVNATFVAEDPYGEKAKGNMTIVVTPKKAKSFDFNEITELAKTYKWYIMLGLLFLIIIILVLSSNRKRAKSESEDKKNQEEGFFKNF